MAKPSQHLFGGLTIGMLVTDGFEQVEMTAPRDALEEEQSLREMIDDVPGAAAMGGR